MRQDWVPFGSGVDVVVPDLTDDMLVLRKRADDLLLRWLTQLLNVGPGTPTALPLSSNGCMNGFGVYEVEMNSDANSRIF